jgi:hypothetical protein
MNNEEVLKFSELAKFLPKQKDAQEASKRFKFVLYGGSLGSGKSYWLRWMMVYWLMKYFAKYNLKGVRAGLFCEDYPSLNDRHLSKVRYEFPAWLGKYNEAKHEFTLAPEYGSGVIAFRNLDDPEKYLSVEFAVMGVDEVNRNPVVTFRELRKRLRWSGIKDVKFLAACNPRGEAWVKNMWVKRMFPPEENEPYEFVFVPALPTDNPNLDASYWKSLESLPEAERKAFLEGDWDSFDASMDDNGYIRLVNDRELQTSIVNSGEHMGYKILGVDPAAGGDNSAVVLKSANLQEVLFNQKLENTMDLVGKVSQLYRENQCDFIVVDATGIGQGVFDRLRDMGLPIRGVSFGEKSEEDQFQNLKAEWHWRERKWLLSGGRLLYNIAWNEFEYVKYKNKDGKILIQQKEELFKQGLMSPNCVDAAVLTMVIEDKTIKNQKFAKQNAGKHYDVTDSIWKGEPSRTIERYM